MRLNAPAAPWTHFDAPRPQQAGHGSQHRRGRVLLWASAQGDPGARVQVGTGSPGEGGTGSACPPGLVTGLSGYLQDDGADLPHALDDGVWHPRDSDGPFGGVGQQVAGHLHLRPRALWGAKGDAGVPQPYPPRGSVPHTSPIPSLAPEDPQGDAPLLCHLHHLPQLPQDHGSSHAEGSVSPRGKGEPIPSASPPESPGS